MDLSGDYRSKATYQTRFLVLCWRLGFFEKNVKVDICYGIHRIIMETKNGILEVHEGTLTDPYQWQWRIS